MTENASEYDYTASPATRVTTVRLPLSLARELEIVARVDGVTQTAVIVAAIDHYIKVRTSTVGFRAAAAALLARDQARAASLGVIYPPCSGASDCTAPKHEHGCFADRDGAACTDPEDHPDPRCCCDQTTARLIVCPIHPERHIPPGAQS